MENIEKRDIVFGVCAVATFLLLAYNGARAYHTHMMLKPSPAYCAVLRDEAFNRCGDEMENTFMDMGGDNYTRGIHKHDNDRCHRVGEAVYFTCNNYEG